MKPTTENVITNKIETNQTQEKAEPTLQEYRDQVEMKLKTFNRTHGF